MSVALTIVALLVALMLDWGGGPAAAQERTERVLVDVELWMGQGAEQHLCFVVPPGDLTVTASVTRALIVPTTVAVRVYGLTGDLGGRPSDGLDMAVKAEPQTVRATLDGGPYCWAVEASSFAHNTGEPSIALRITHRVH